MDEARRLIEFVRRSMVERMRRDPRAGGVYAIGFDRNGNPYRAYSIDTRHAGDDLPDGYSYAE